MTTFIAILIVLMICGALIATLSRNLLHSIISLGAVGFLLSIVFVFLGAPDLAITQLAVEVITLVLLLRTVKGERSDQPVSRPSRTSQVSAAVLVLGLAAFSYQLFAKSPDFGSPVLTRVEEAPSLHYLDNGLEETGAANIVTAILLDYRGYDTLGEATVLFCAIVGAITILQLQRRKVAKRGIETDDDEEEKA